MTTLKQDVERIWPGAVILEFVREYIDVSMDLDRFRLMTLENASLHFEHDARGEINGYARRLVVKHPKSPVTITYTLDWETGMPDIALSGLFSGKPHDRKMAIRLIDTFLDRMSKRGPKTLDIYDRAFQRLLAGEDKKKVNKEFLESNPNIEEANYKNAMSRRRKWVKEGRYRK